MLPRPWRLLFRRPRSDASPVKWSDGAGPTLCSVSRIIRTFGSASAQSALHKKIPSAAASTAAITILMVFFIYRSSVCFIVSVGRIRAFRDFPIFAAFYAAIVAARAVPPLWAAADS